MTTLSLLGGTWEYQFEDETVGSGVTGTRMFVYLSGGVVTSRALYSDAAATLDEFTAMGFKNPILPVTPNEYTLENKAFISRTSKEFLKEGTIKADYSLVGSAGNNSGRGVLKVGYTDDTPLDPGDIGRQVSQATTLDTGTLLDYDTDPDGSLIMWVRPDDSTPGTGDIFDGTGIITVVGGVGVTATSVAGISGQTDHVAIQAIGSVPAATDVYAIQDRIKLTDAATNTFQWWDTDPDVSLGIISILVTTRDSGVQIASGDIEVFAHKYGSLYDNFRLNVAAGGFSALPLASAPDINNTTGYRTTGTLSGITGTATVGNGIYVGGTWATATAKGVITETNGNTDLEYYLVGDLTDIGSTTAITEYDFTTLADGDFDATTGTVGVNLGGPTDTTSGEGGNVTITIGHTTVDHDNTGTAEPYSITVDAQSNIAIAKVYERIKYVCRRGQDNTFWDTVSCSVPGEQYRGVEALYYFDATTATMVEGEDINNETQVGQTARLLSLNDPFAGEDVAQDYVTVTDLQDSTFTTANNDVWADDGSTNDFTVDTGGAGGAIVTHASVKASPFGSFTGTQIFGAPGISYINPGSGDAQSYILTDDLGTLRSPPNTITYTIANTRALDRCYAARDTGTAGVIDKDQFGGMTAVAASSKTITVAGTIDSEVPTGAGGGYVRVVETTLQEEHKYEYTSRTTGAGGVFTLTDITASTANDTGATTTPTLLNDSTATFESEGVNPGMLIQDTTNSDTYEVVSLVTGFEETRINIQQVFGTGGTLASGDDYTINETIQLYATSDDIFDLIIDAEENTGTDGVPGTISNTLVKTPASDFGTVAQVRQGKDILPFEQNQTQGDGNTTVTTVRTPDTIAV